MLLPSFKIGDRVEEVAHPEWGIGEVLRALPAGAYELSGSIYNSSRKSVGQSLEIRFADGRTRNLISSARHLRLVE